MDRHRFEGLWLPLVTPFADSALDEPSIAALVRHYLDMPIDGLILAANASFVLRQDANALDVAKHIVRRRLGVTTT